MEHPLRPSRVYGPYLHSAGKGRKIIIMIMPDGTRRTTANARYIVECREGRLLGPDEQVDHHDDDPSNDDPANLIILTPEANRQKYASANPAPTRRCVCPICGVEVVIPERVYQRNQVRRGCSGPYCSKACAGRGGSLAGSGRRGGTGLHA